MKSKEAHCILKYRSQAPLSKSKVKFKISSGSWVIIMHSYPCSSEMISFKRISSYIFTEKKTCLLSLFRVVKNTGIQPFAFSSYSKNGGAHSILKWIIDFLRLINKTSMKSKFLFYKGLIHSPKKGRAMLLHYAQCLI